MSQTAPETGQNLRGSARAWLLDGGVIVAITALVAVVSQRWASISTPDSSFYLSLGIFGHDVTDRAPVDTYYWTRLGTIAPSRLLTELLGTWPGLATYRVLLIGVVVGSMVAAFRCFASRPAAALVAALLSLNTVMLTFIGNPYPTAAVFAGTAVVVSASLRRTPVAAVAAGVGLGWLAMTHPPGLLLGATLWVALSISARRSLRDVGLTAVGALAAFGGLWVAGRILFPGLDWLGTLLDWGPRLHYADFASRASVWLQDISLLVPAAVLVTTTIAWLLNRGERWAQLAWIVALSSVGFTLVFNPLMGGVPLEAPMYEAALWLPMLMALGVLVAGRLGHTPLPLTAWVVGAISVVAVIAVGHWTGGWSLGIGIVIAALAVAALAGAIAAWPRVRARAAASLLIAALGIVLAAAQGLQNSRPALGLYAPTTYSNAFRANDIGARYHVAVNVERWVLDHTSPDDDIVSWVGGDWQGGDRELYAVAAMQLWGENRVSTLGPTMSDEDNAALADLQPSVLLMVAPTMDRVLAFWSSLPAATHPTAPECYDFAWPSDTVTTGHACLTRLTWPSP